MHPYRTSARIECKPRRFGATRWVKFFVKLAKACRFISHKRIKWIRNANGELNSYDIYFVMCKCNWCTSTKELAKNSYSLSEIKKLQDK